MNLLPKLHQTSRTVGAGNFATVKKNHRKSNIVVDE